MRILHVFESLGGGVAHHVETLVAEQLQRGDDVAVVLPDQRLVGETDDAILPRFRRSGAAVFTFKVRPPAFHPANASIPLAVGRAIRKWRPDVIHTHSSIGGAFGRVPAWPLRVPVVHTPNGVRFSDPTESTATRLTRLGERAQAAMTTTVIAVSESEAGILRGVYPAHKVVVIPNARDHDVADPPLPDRFRVVAVNRLAYQKDPEQVVRIMAAARRVRPEIEAVIVGTGPLEHETASLIARLDPGIQRSQVSGIDALRTGSALLLASRWEGAPYVVLEAMSVGRPVVASDVVGTRDEVVDGETGFLFAAGDVDSAAARLVQLADDRELTQRLGAAGRARVAGHFSVKSMIDALHDVYGAAITASGR